MHEFLEANARFLALDDEHAQPEKARFVVLPVPFEQTSSYGRGSAYGPAAILEASHQVELYDASLGCKPYAAAGGIATLAPLETDDCDGAAMAERLNSAAGHWLDADKRVIALGGEHTSVVGTIRAHVERYRDLTVLQLDAHSDLRPSYQEDPWSHACAMARVLDFHENLVQVGIRSQSEQERAISQERGLPVVYGEAIHGSEERGRDWIAQVIEATSRRVYVTFDCDVLDAPAMPATGTPEPGGLTWRQVTRLFARLTVEREVVGFDVSELAPIEGFNHPQYTVAKLIYRFVGYMRGATSP
jgi:N1-aminopropylagmatine ureohydrolase